MKSIFVLLIAFVGLGLLTRNFNTRTRLLVFFVAASMVAYVSLG